MLQRSLHEKTVLCDVQSTENTICSQLVMHENTKCIDSILHDISILTLKRGVCKLGKH